MKRFEFENTERVTLLSRSHSLGKLHSEVLRAAACKTSGPPSERKSQQPLPVAWELLQYLRYSLAREQKCAWTDCGEGFRQAGEASISYYLAGLAGCLVDGAGGLRSISAW